MTFDIRGLLAEHAKDRFRLHERHVNDAFVRMLHAIGFDVGFERAEGAYLYDGRNARYLDLLSGWGVFALGRNHPTVARALHDAIDAKSANLVQFDVSAASGLLARELLRRAPYLDRALFCNSGAEAVEAAIKFSRAATRRDRIVYCDHAFHGLTTGALSLNGDAMFRDGFGRLLPDVTAVPFNDVGALEAELAKGDVAAFIVEPIQGKSVALPAPGYLPEASRLCRKHGALFVADEVQTGLGRTGRFFAVEHDGVEPDLILIAKALSGGFVPVGAMLGRDWIFRKVFDRTDRCVVHGTTFGKNDLAMVAGLATLHVLESENLVERSAHMGEAIMGDLRAIIGESPFLKDVRGRGLMIGLEFGAPERPLLEAGWRLIEKANAGLFSQMILVPLFKQHRILCQVASHHANVIKLLPPFIVDDGDRRWIETAFRRTILDCNRLHGAAWSLGRDLAGHALKARA